MRGVGGVRLHQAAVLAAGQAYEAYFADAGGISPGSDVNVSGIKVGKVTGVALAGDVAKVTFTVDRKIRVGDQSLVSIRTRHHPRREVAGGDARRARASPRRSR